MILTATCRSSTSSCASSTSAMPPDPSRPRSTYRPPSTLRSAPRFNGVVSSIYRLLPSLLNDRFHDVLRDRRGDRTARRLAAHVPALGDDDGDRDLRVVRRREAGEPHRRVAS